MTNRGLFLALLAAAALFICASRPVSAAPALWLVQGPAGKAYLFGTVHLLRDGVQWRSTELASAMNESQDLYLEIADPANVAAVLPATVKLGFDRDHPLSTKISKADVALLDAAAKKYHLGSEAAFEPMQPWLVFLMLSVMPEVHSGYASGNGVDVQVRKNFVAASKPVYGLESVETQIHIFSDMPQATQVALLEAALKSTDEPKTGVTQLDTIVGAWTSGNQDDLAAALQFDTLASSPMSAQLLTNRNKAWAAALAERLKQPGTSFVSVGAAHMLGPDGLPALLAGMGFSVTRVNVATMLPADTPSPVSSVSPSPAASATPIPQTLTPPKGWTKKPASVAAAGALKIDTMWVDPKGQGVILTAHLDLPSSLGTVDLDTLDALVHQGLVAGAGAKAVQSSTHVKVCGGKQEAIYTKLALASAKEDLVLAMSDRAYLAQYVRRADVSDDPAAVQALLSLCAP